MLTAACLSDMAFGIPPRREPEMVSGVQSAGAPGDDETWRRALALAAHPANEMRTVERTGAVAVPMASVRLTSLARAGVVGPGFSGVG